MGLTKIAWATYTFNPWLGCTKVAPECKHCYAEAFNKRTGKAAWGDSAERLITSPGNWREPLKWDRKARQTSGRTYVFCASLADVFEERRELNAPREWLWPLIDATPYLTWLLLTKRAAQVEWMAPMAWLDRWPSNVWLGATCGHPDSYPNVRALCQVQADIPVRFVSAEPLLASLNLSPFLGPDRVTWVISGGESTQGASARPCDVGWIRSIDRQCKDRGIAHFVKQMGSKVEDRNDAGFEGDKPGAWPMDTHYDDLDPMTYQGAPVRIRLRDRAGANLNEWPADLRVREFPATEVHQ